MFRRRRKMTERLREVVKTFRQKGATRPENALSPKELGLLPAFEDAMQRRLGRSGVFVEINGKYFLSEARLKQVKERFPSR